MKMKKIILFLVIFLFFSACSSTGIKQDTGDTAFDFTLPNQSGEMVTLSKVLAEYKGAVIAFYPKDDTKNWTREFVEFQQNIKEFEKRNIKVLGISRDSIKSHQKFIAKHGLKDITLLSDEEKKVIHLYGVSHWLLPVAKRVYIIVDNNRKIIYKKDKGFALLEKQTETLLEAIDTEMR